MFKIYVPDLLQQILTATLMTSPSLQVHPSAQAPELLPGVWERREQPGQDPGRVRAGAAAGVKEAQAGEEAHEAKADEWHQEEEEEAGKGTRNTEHGTMLRHLKRQSSAPLKT